MKVRLTILAATLILTSGFAQLATAQDAVRQVRGPIWISVPGSPAAMQSATIKAPATGYVVVTVTGTFNYSHTYGTAGFYCLQLSPISGYAGGCVPDAGSDSAVRGYVAAAVPTTIPGYGFERAVFHHPPVCRNSGRHLQLLSEWVGDGIAEYMAVPADDHGSVCTGGAGRVTG